MNKRIVITASDYEAIIRFEEDGGPPTDITYIVIDDVSGLNLYQRRKTGLPIQRGQDEEPNEHAA